MKTSASVPASKNSQKTLFIFIGTFVAVVVLALTSSLVFSSMNLNTYRDLTGTQNAQLQELIQLKKELASQLKELQSVQSADKLDLSQQIALLREELIKSKSQGSAVLGTKTENVTPQPTIAVVGIVQLNKKWQTADVFQDARASSKIVGQAVRGKIYFVHEQQTGWYQIELSDTKYGWIQAQLIDEL